MMKQTKVHVLSILISIINTKGIYQNHILTVNLNILKIHQCAHLILSYTKKNSNIVYTLIVDVDYQKYLEISN